jgi:roadblock/LC7 domain-containing protein
MGANLDKLMNLGGAVAAGQFSVGGDLVDYKGDLSREHAEMVAMMCAANSLMGRMQAESFTKHTGMNWSPFKGWAVAAGDYSVCVMGSLGVFVETDKADFNEIFQVLGGEAGVI